MSNTRMSAVFTEAIVRCVPCYVMNMLTQFVTGFLRRLSGFGPRAIVVWTVAIGQAFLQKLRFFPVNIFTQMPTVY